MRFSKRAFSFLLVTAFLLSHSLAEYSHKLFHAAHNDICVDLPLPVSPGTTADQDSACPIEKLLKSTASETFNFSTAVTFTQISLEHSQLAQLFTKIYSVPSYENEFSRGPPSRLKPLLHS